MSKLKIVVVDDHELVRDGFISLLQSIPGYNVIGSFGNGGKLLSFIANTKELPDVILMDIDMPVINGIEAARRLKESHPYIKIIMLTMHDTNNYFNRVAASGADGFMLKSSDKESLVEAVSCVVKGKGFFPKKKSTVGIKSSNKDCFVKLTSREVEILKLIAQGFSNKEIGDQLNISIRTVDTHRTRLKGKLKVNGIAGLVKYAFQQGLVH